MVNVMTPDRVMSLLVFIIVVVVAPSCGASQAVGTREAMHEQGAHDVGIGSKPYTLKAEAVRIPLLAQLKGTARFRAFEKNPSPEMQTEGGDYGRDISKCNPGCDYTSGYRCCKDHCQDIELNCES